MPNYRIGRLKDRFVLVWRDSNGRRYRCRYRYCLESKDARGVAFGAPAIYATLIKPKGNSVGEIWQAYLIDHQGRAIEGNMPHTWKALSMT